MKSGTEYKKLEPTDARRAAYVLAESFVNDPLCAYMLPLKITRTKTLRRFFLPYARINILQGFGFGVGS
jgi:hypothetical protein